MKRFILAILSFVYLSTSTGANLRFHYCMGKLESWSIGHAENKECGRCGMERKAAENSGCCKDEFKHIKLKVDQKSNNVVAYQFNVVESESILAFIAYTDDPIKQEIITSNLIDNNSPRRSCIATYLRNRNFRI